MGEYVPIPAARLTHGVALMAEATQGMLSNPNSHSATPDSINAPAEAHITPTNSANSNIHISLDEYTLIDERQYQNAHSSPIFSYHDLPSDYLHARCLCCFGSASSINSGLLANCIISFNANFQLKKIRDHDCHPQYRDSNQPGSPDPKMMSPQMMEVPCSYAEKWEGKVSELCQSKQKPKLTTHGTKRKVNVMDCGDRDDDAKQNQIAAGLKLTEETYDC